LWSLPATAPENQVIRPAWAADSAGIQALRLLLLAGPADEDLL